MSTTSAPPDPPASVAGPHRAAPADAPPADQDPTTSRRHWGWTLGVVSLALFMVVLDNLIVTVGLPDIRRSLGASLESLTWTINAYTLSFAVLLVPAAALGDRLGRKRVLLTGVSLFAGASAVAALAPSAGVLIAARVVQGAGGAMVAPLTLTLLSVAVPREKRGMALGIWSAVSGLGVALGPLVGGATIELGSWHWMFWINVPVAVVLVPLGLRVLSESRPDGPAERLDLPGFALITTGLLGVVFGLVRAEAAGWTSPQIVGPIAGGLVLLGLFVAWERRAAHPMVPMRLFASRGFRASNAASFFMFFGTFGSIFLLTQELQGIFGYDALDAGLRMLVWTGTTMLVAPIVTPLAERLGARWFMAAGLGLQAAGLAWIAAASHVGMSWHALIGPFVLAGAGMALVFGPSASAVLASVREADAGRGSGVNNAIREVGGAFGVAVLSTVFSSSGALTSPQGIVDGTRPAVWVGAAVVLVGALVATRIPSPKQMAADLAASEAALADATDEGPGDGTPADRPRPTAPRTTAVA